MKLRHKYPLGQTYALQAGDVFKGSCKGFTWEMPIDKPCQFNQVMIVDLLPGELNTKNGVGIIVSYAGAEPTRSSNRPAIGLPKPLTRTVEMDEEPAPAEHFVTLQ